MEKSVTRLIGDLLERHYGFSNPWALMVFLGPMPWLVRPDVQVPVWVKVAAVVVMIVGFALAHGARRGYAVLVFVGFDMMGHVSWLAILRPHFLLAAMLFGMHLDNEVAKRRSKDVFR